MFYWIDFLVGTATTIYLAIQWFLYTDHSLPDLANNPEETQQNDDTFKAESIVSIIFLCLIRITHVKFSLCVYEMETKPFSVYSSILHLFSPIIMYHLANLNILK
jgi:hypothetical protein